MQQRQPRLGDVVDDYCPRERRITNHAVVAMIDAEIKQTRCTTCDAEHEFKKAKVPATRRKKDAAAGLVKDALAGAPELRPDTSAEAVEEAPRPRVVPPVVSAPEPVVAQAEAAPAPAEAETFESAEPEPDREGAGDELDEGPVHRRLIRATLPRPEGQPTTRPAPQFTLRQPGARGGSSHPGGGKTRQAPRHRPGHAGGTRQASGPVGRSGFGRSNGRPDFSARTGGRPDHQRVSRPSHPGRPRDGKKHSK